MDHVDTDALIARITDELVRDHGWRIPPGATARCLGRSSSGLESTMASRLRRRQNWARRLRRGRVRMGRRIFYLAPAVAACLVLGDAPLSGDETLGAETGDAAPAPADRRADSEC